MRLGDMMKSPSPADEIVILDRPGQVVKSNAEDLAGQVLDRPGGQQPAFWAKNGLIILYVI